MTFRNSIPSAVLAATVFLFVPGRAAEPDPKIMSVTLPDHIQWKISEGADTAMLQGDPSKPGVYIELVRWHAGHMSRPHMHSTERYIRVLSGTWYAGQGPKYDPASTYPVPAGSYVVHHADQIHYDGAKDADCMLYIVGTGPMTTKGAEIK